MSIIDYNLYCSLCAGDLRGADITGFCPHCQAVITDTLAVGLLDTDSHTVDQDVTCIECGYNLRMLRVDARCPECGKEVLDSVRPDDLRFADTKWLKRVRGGVTNLLLAVGTFVIMVLYEIVGSPPVIFLEKFLLAASIGGSIFCLVMGVTGVLRASALDPHPRTPRGVRIANKIAQWGCVLPIMVVVSFVFVSALANRLLGFFGFMFVGMLMLLTYAVPVAICYCLRHVAKRGHRDGARMATTALMWSVGAVGVLMILAFVGTAFMVRPMMSAATGPGPYATAPKASSASPAPGSPATTAPSSAVTTTTTTATGGVTTFASPMASKGFVLLGCMFTALMWILVPGSLMLGVVVLFMYRDMLGTAIANAPSARMAGLDNRVT